MLNIDALHNIVGKINNAEPCDAHSGVTPAYLHLMMGEVWLGGRENQYVYIGLNTGHVHTVCLDFLAMLNADQADGEYPKRDIRVIHRGGGYHVIVNQQVFIFVSSVIAATPDFWMGARIDRVFIDLNEYRDRVPQEIIQTILAFDGDIL